MIEVLLVAAFLYQGPSRIQHEDGSSTEGFAGRCVYDGKEEDGFVTLPCDGVARSVLPDKRLVLTFLNRPKPAFAFVTASAVAPGRSRVRVDAVYPEPGWRIPVNGECAIEQKDGVLLSAVCAAEVGNRTFVGNFEGNYIRE